MLAHDDPGGHTFAALRERLGYLDSDLISINYAAPGVDFDFDIVPVAEADAVVAKHSTGFDVWHGVNPLREGIPNWSNGTEADVTRLVALYCDLDLKSDHKLKGFASIEDIDKVIDAVSAVLGVRPSYVVMSGHGAQPYWPLDPASAAEIAWPRAKALLKAFGDLVALKTEDLFGDTVAVDSVYDLARRLRTPGTQNVKFDEVADVTGREDSGAPMTVEEVIEQLWTVSIELTEDEDLLTGEEVSAPDTWRFHTGGCDARYAPNMVLAWKTDPEPPHRHNWHFSKLIKVACAWRSECFKSQVELDAAHAVVDSRLREWREPGAGELRRNWRDAIKKVSTFTNDKVREELGDHTHLRDLIGKKADVSDTALQQESASEPAPSNGSESQSNSGRKVSLLAASDIVSDKPVWAMKYEGIGCIQRGSFALFTGRPAMGKSSAARWLAAGYSRGTVQGCWYKEPQKIAYLAPSEESLVYTIKTGLAAAGADMDYIYFPNVCNAEAKEVQLRSLLDEDALTELLVEAKITVVIVDPIMSTIGGKADVNRNNEVRELIEVWPRIATATNGIVIAVSHLIKQPGSDIVAAINGSSAFGEVARAVFAFHRDPKSEEGHRILSQEKNSTGRADLALVYDIVEQEITTDTGLKAEIGKFEILGKSDRKVSDVMGERREVHTVTQEAEDWIGDYLKVSGKVPSKDVKAAAKKEGGFSKAAIDRAAAKLKVVVTSNGTFPRVTHWHLPGFMEKADICEVCRKPVIDELMHAECVGGGGSE